MRYIVFLILFVGLLFANTKTQITRDLITTPPPEASRSGYKVIKRVYRVVENNTTEPEKEQSKRFFVGAGAGFSVVDRSIVIDSENSGAIIELDGKDVVADGSNYSMTQTKRYAVPSLEIGFNKTDILFYGTKLGIYKDFTELSVFGGARFENVAFYGFTPMMQVQGGIGYKKIKGAAPDNLTVAVIGGAEKFIKGNYLSIGTFLSYKHRYWQKIKMNYGTEYWRDNEIGASVVARYLF